MAVIRGDVPLGCVDGVASHRKSHYLMGLKPDFLEALANTVMEHDKIQITNANMLLKERDSSTFCLGSPRIEKTGLQAEVKVNGLSNSEDVADFYQGSSDVQKPLHVQVNGFGKASGQSLPSSSLSATYPISPSPVASQDGCSSAANSLVSGKSLASPALVLTPSSGSKIQPTFPKLPPAAGDPSALATSTTASRREVEVTRRKTVVDKIVKGKERNAFRFFVSGFETQTPTQLAMTARRLKSTAEEKMPKHMITRIYGEEEARNVKKRITPAQLARPTRPVPDSDGDYSTDLSDIEIQEKVDSVSTKWGHVKAAVCSDMKRNAVEIENASRNVEDVDGFLCIDDQVPSCSSEASTRDSASCSRVRPVDERYRSRRRQQLSYQFRSDCELRKRGAYSSACSPSLPLDKVNCSALRRLEAFARTISMAPVFSIRSRVDVPIWLNRDSVGEERRRCAAIHFSDADDIDQLQPVSKLKRVQLAERSSVSSFETSSMEESEDERKDKSYTGGECKEKRRQESRRSRNRKKCRRRTRRLLGAETDSDPYEVPDPFFKVKLEMPKYSDVEVPKWRKLSQGELADFKHHHNAADCCSSDRLEVSVAKRHLRLAKEERLYFEGKRREMPSIESDDTSEREADLTSLLECSLTESERAQYDRSAPSQSGKESGQRPR